MATDKKHLTLRGANYYLNYKVPKGVTLKGKYANKSVIQKSLKTDSLREARKLRDGFLLKLLESYTEKSKFNSEYEELRYYIHDIKSTLKDIADNNTNDPEKRFQEEVGIVDALHGGWANTPVKEAAVKIALGANEHNTFVKGLSLHEATVNYLKKRTNISDSMRARIKHADKEYKKYKDGRDTEIYRITRPEVAKFIDTLSSKGLNIQTIRNYLSALTGVWDFTKDRNEEEMGISPFKDHKIYQASSKKKEVKPWSVDEWEILATTLSKSKAITYSRKWLAPIALVSGLRIEELCGLQKRDVIKDEQTGIIYFNIHPEVRPVKNKSSIRKVPVHHSILEAVLTLKESSSNDFLFEEVVTRGDRYSGTLGTWFSRVKNRTFPNRLDLNFHSFRKNTATGLDNSNANNDIVKTLLGHARGSISFDTYSSGKKLESLSDALESATEEFKPYIELFPKV